ncbi:protein FAM187B [Heteronotia binoei]|uniref:protein FAM187B n=1 Tax=Heteronotia binoei TaxID=13085 RepID=UPI0029317D28|nr:protein FAM187B [Heteronotia binoei]
MSSRAATACLFLSLTLAVTKGALFTGHSLGSPCVPSHGCTLAFVSDNPVILHCPHGSLGVFITWQYLDLAQTDKEPTTFLHSKTKFLPVVSYANLRRLQLKAWLLGDNLYISSPNVQDSGLYTCRSGDATLAYYQVDFQDADNIHISHASLRETTLSNTTTDLGNGAQAQQFTSWGHWQPCNRCDHPGERKRVGFCYALVSTGKEQGGERPLPCGIARRKHPTLPKRGPELRVEACHVLCNESYLLGKGEPNTVPLLVYTTYYPSFQDTAYLRCPTSSIYSPVYWQEGSTMLTRLQLLQQNSSSLSLDERTGGGVLRLSFQNHTQSTFYRCYVNGQLVGKFLVTAPSTFPSARELTLTSSIIEALVVGTAMFLVFLMFLSIIQSCRKKPAAAVI